MYSGCLLFEFRELALLSSLKRFPAAFSDSKNGFLKRKYALGLHYLRILVLSANCPREQKKKKVKGLSLVSQMGHFRNLLISLSVEECVRIPFPR